MNGILLVALGGAAGAVTRHLIGLGMKAASPNYLGAGTLIVNVVGSLLIGYLLGMMAEPKGQPHLTEPIRLLLVTGFLGGLTTFSSLAHETMRLSSQETGLRDGLLHLSANVILGLGAVWLGAALRR